MEKYGWVCPKCETIYSPEIKKCEKCESKNESKIVNLNEIIEKPKN